MPSAYFNHSNKSTIANRPHFQYITAKKHRRMRSKVYPPALFMGKYLQIFLNGFLQFKWVLNAFLYFAILVDDE